MPSEALVQEWPSELDKFVQDHGTVLRLRATRTNGWAWLYGLFGLIILGVAILGLVLELSVWTLLLSMLLLPVGSMFVLDAAYVLYGHTDIKRTPNEWLVEKVLGRLRLTRRFPPSAPRVARRVSGTWSTATTDTGRHIELEVDRARPILLGGGFYLEDAQLEALATLFGVDLIGMMD